ncbi:MAG: hypothetical protein RLZZ428_492 [Pseudomonadota bacterium]|jgi:competence protein ComEA
MFRKIVTGFVAVATTVVFGMSLEELNGASKEELMAIKGVGASKAEAIMEERTKEPFKSFEDLQRVKGVGPSLANKIKESQK